VILVHRMLTNSVPVPEYLLMTQPVLDRCEERVRDVAVAIDEELEGLGAERLYYVDIHAFAEQPPAPKKTLPRRQALTGGQVVRGVPYLVGLKHAPELAGADAEPEALR